MAQEGDFCTSDAECAELDPEALLALDLICGPEGRCVERGRGIVPPIDDTTIPPPLPPPTCAEEGEQCTFTTFLNDGRTESTCCDGLSCIDLDFSTYEVTSIQVGTAPDGTFINEQGSRVQGICRAPVPPPPPEPTVNSFSLELSADPPEGGTLSARNFSGENLQLISTEPIGEGRYLYTWQATSDTITGTISVSTNDGYEFQQWTQGPLFIRQQTVKITIGSTNNVNYVASFKKIEPTDQWIECEDGSLNDYPITPGYVRSTTATGEVCYQPAPSQPPPEQWRNCLDNRLYDNPIPSGYERSLTDTGLVCYQPRVQLTFIPSLSSLEFNYQRGSSELPTQKNIVAKNAGDTAVRVELKTNERYFKISNSTFIVPPNGEFRFSIETNGLNIEEMGDGQTVFRLDVDVSRITD